MGRGAPPERPDPADAAAAAGQDEPEELLDVGRPPRRPRWARAGRRGARRPRGARLGAAALLLAGGVLVLRSAGESRPAPPPPELVAPRPPVDGPIAMVEAAAHDPGAFADYVRPDGPAGACALVPVGRSPQQALARALRRDLPAYRVRDVSRTLDQFTGLCSLRLRAADRSGSVLVAQVVAPATEVHCPYDRLTVDSSSDGRVTVSVAIAVSRRGWSVTIGTIGPALDQPSSAALLALAQDPTLTW